MHARLIKILHDTRASYWFVPMCMVLGAMLLAFALRWLDHHHAMSWLSGLMPATADDAQTILSTIATAVLGVAGVTFSITMVAVSFASSNYGPRLINNFMRDKGSQMTLGTFIGTFAYCLTVMTSVHGSVTLESGKDIAAFVPQSSILLALILALISVCMLIFFIHHITETINIENITADIGRSLAQRITELFPQPDTDLLMRDESDFDTAIQSRQVHQVDATTVGYVQAIDLEELNSIAREQELLIMVHYRPGDFVTNHDCLLSVWTSGGAEFDTEELRQCFASGEERTEQQNVLFLAEQLSEVIARALSPGINDPYTAMSCLNRFRTALMEYLHQQRHADNDNEDCFAWKHTRVQLQPIDLTRLCVVMFDQTRQYIASDKNVTLHVMALLSECGWYAGPGEARELFSSHLQRMHDCACLQQEHQGDQDLLSQRFEAARHIMYRNDDIHHVRHETPWFGGSA